MAQLRDVYLKRQSQLNRKQDALPYIRAVITDSLGNQSGSGSIWYNENERRVWYMALGSNQPAQVRCVRITPTIGLGVIIGFVPGTQEKEVLSDDPFLRASNVTGTSYISPGPGDFEPGGRLQLWLYTKMITPLATYPTSGMLVNTIAGDYPYLGQRVTFPGATGTDLTASIPATPGEHRLVGLYLDAANTLQTIDGTAVVVATTPPEPTWPDGAFQLCVIKLTNGDTSIDFANLTDRRMAWTDTVSSSSTWPRPGKVNIGVTEYATITLAAAAAVSGDLIKVGEGTFAETFTLPDGVDLFGSGIGITNIITSDAGALITIAGTSTVKDLTLENGGAGEAITSVGSDVFLLDINDTGGGLTLTGGGSVVTDCIFSSVTTSTSGGHSFYGGSIGDLTIGASTSVFLHNTVIENPIVNSGIISGNWIDDNGRIFARYHRHFQMMGA